MSASVEVVVALIEDAAGRVLVSRRLPGRHMAGYWEFPGGKRAPGEARREALARELGEELGIEVLAAEPYLELVHEYADRRVALDVWRVCAYTGVPRGLEGQEIAWQTPAALARIRILPADAGIVARLRAPEDSPPSSTTAENRCPE